MYGERWGDVCDPVTVGSFDCSAELAVQLTAALIGYAGVQHLAIQLVDECVTARDAPVGPFGAAGRAQESARARELFATGLDRARVRCEHVGQRRHREARVA